MKSITNNFNYLREQVNDRLDVEDVCIENGIEYKQMSIDEYRIHCPFHNERTPSCFISDTKKVFHCFGCMKSGDLIFLLSKIKKKPIDILVNEYVLQYDIKFPTSLDQVIEIEKTKNPLIEEVDLLNSRIDMLYALKNHLFKEMIKVAPFSDEMVDYYKCDIYIMNLEEELSDLNFKNK